jgi:hypothetical protein
MVMLAGAMPSPISAPAVEHKMRSAVIAIIRFLGRVFMDYGPFLKIKGEEMLNLF